MRLSQLAKRILPLYQTRTPVTLSGSPGIGKSDMVHTLPKILSDKLGVEFGHVTVEASTLDSPDVIGFLVPQKNAEGEAIARYTKPDIIRQIELSGCDHGILFIDEIGQADALVQKALASLFIEGKLGEYRIPEGWMVISATNRIEDRAGVTKELSHFTNRQCKVEIEANTEDWTAWARENGVHHMAIAFANFRPAVVMTSEVPAKPGPYCTPRSFTNAAKFLRNMIDHDEDELPSDEVTQAIVSGYIGEASSAELFGFLKVHEHLPTFADILKDPMKAKLPPKENLAASYAAAALVIAKADATNVDPAFTYCTRLPIEMQTSVARSLILTIQGAALNSKAISDFIVKNNALIQTSLD